MEPGGKNPLGISQCTGEIAAPSTNPGSNRPSAEAVWSLRAGIGEEPESRYLQSRIRRARGAHVTSGAGVLRQHLGPSEGTGSRGRDQRLGCRRCEKLFRGDDLRQSSGWQAGQCHELRPRTRTTWTDPPHFGHGRSADRGTDQGDRATGGSGHSASRAAA